MRLINCTLVIFIFLTVFYFILINYSDDKAEPFSCVAQIEQESTMAGQSVHINAVVTVFLIGWDHGFFSMIGSVSVDEEIYNLNRKVSFVIAPHQIHGMKMVRIISVKLHRTDNTPEDVWSDYITPEAVGAEFYVRIKKINKNAILVNSLSLPYLLCAIQNG